MIQITPPNRTGRLSVVGRPGKQRLIDIIPPTVVERAAHAGRAVTYGRIPYEWSLTPCDTQAGSALTDTHTLENCADIRSRRDGDLRHSMHICLTDDMTPSGQANANVGCEPATEGNVLNDAVLDNRTAREAEAKYLFGLLRLRADIADDHTSQNAITGRKLNRCANLTVADDVLDDRSFRSAHEVNESSVEPPDRAVPNDRIRTVHQDANVLIV